MVADLEFSFSADSKYIHSCGRNIEQACDKHNNPNYTLESENLSNIRSHLAHEDFFFFFSGFTAGHMESYFPHRDGISAPYVGRLSLNLWTNSEVCPILLLNK